MYILLFFIFIMLNFIKHDNILVESLEFNKLFNFFCFSSIFLCFLITINQHQIKHKIVYKLHFLLSQVFKRQPQRTIFVAILLFFSQNFILLLMHPNFLQSLLGLLESPADTAFQTLQSFLYTDNSYKYFKMFGNFNYFNDYINDVFKQV